MEFNTPNIQKHQLEKIFYVQYNDIFSKIITSAFQDLFSMLKKQVLYHLKIIGLSCEIPLLYFLYDKYYNLIKNEQLRIRNIYKTINKKSSSINNYLDILDIYIHCFRCKEAVHKCGNKLIIFDDLYFCIKCKKVYNHNQIKLYCKECKKTYLTTGRNEEEIRNGYLYRVSFINYHCFSENEELIKCLNCGDYLYYNPTKIKVEEILNKRIIDIYCIKCKLIFDTTKIFFNCNICGNNFKCQPQIYRNFSSSKKYVFILIHAFRKGKYALPSSNNHDIIKKECNCNINGVMYFLHNDNGILYEGKKNGYKVIICDYCYGMFNFENFNWNCPFCGIEFNTNKKLFSPVPNKTQIKKMHDKSNILNNIYINSFIYPIPEINNENGNKKKLKQSHSFYSHLNPNNNENICQSGINFNEYNDKINDINREYKNSIRLKK